MCVCVGHAWWPGRISGPGIASDSILSTMKGSGILIFFFGQHNYPLVPAEAIVEFKAFLEEKPLRRSKSAKSKSLKRAIREANAVLNKQITIDESAYLAEIDEPNQKERKVRMGMGMGSRKGLGCWALAWAWIRAWAWAWA